MGEFQDSTNKCSSCAEMSRNQWIQRQKEKDQTYEATEFVVVAKTWEHAGLIHLQNDKFVALFEMNLKRLH